MRGLLPGKMTGVFNLQLLYNDLCEVIDLLEGQSGHAHNADLQTGF